MKSSRMDRQDCGEELCIHLILKWIVAFSGPTFTNEHLFLLNPPLQRVLCIQNSQSLVLYHSCKIFHYEPIKNTISILPLQLVLQKSNKVTLIFATGKSRHYCYLQSEHVNTSICSVFSNTPAITTKFVKLKVIGFCCCSV